MGFFGVVASPWDIDEWEAATGIRADFPMVFEKWSRERTIEGHFAKALSAGYSRLMVTWEPWESVPIGTPSEEQGALQLKWSNDSIAGGYHDAYIRSWAETIRDSGLEMVYIRFAHEMNGHWYPWHNNPEGYVAAWRRIRSVFKKASCANARFIWAPNANLYQDKPKWLSSVLPYWPGADHVHFTGLTAINFGPPRDYSPSQFTSRFSLLRNVFGKSVGAVEMNCAYETRERWLTDFAAVVLGQSLNFVVLSQQESRGAAAMETGEMNWSVTNDLVGLNALKVVVDALKR